MLLERDLLLSLVEEDRRRAEPWHVIGPEVADLGLFSRAGRAVDRPQRLDLIQSRGILRTVQGRGWTRQKGRGVRDREGCHLSPGRTPGVLIIRRSRPPLTGRGTDLVDGFGIRSVVASPGQVVRGDRFAQRAIPCALDAP